MAGKGIDKEPRSPFEWFDLGCSYRKACRFGDAINAYRSAAESAHAMLEMQSGQEEKKKALEEIRSKALASIELMKEINGFVNVDLMNP